MSPTNILRHVILVCQVSQSKGSIISSIMKLHQNCCKLGIGTFRKMPWQIFRMAIFPSNCCSFHLLIIALVPYLGRQVTIYVAVIWAVFRTPLGWWLVAGFYYPLYIGAFFIIQGESRTQPSLGCRRYVQPISGPDQWKHWSQEHLLHLFRRLGLCCAEGQVFHIRNEIEWNLGCSWYTQTTIWQIMGLKMASIPMTLAI